MSAEAVVVDRQLGRTLRPSTRPPRRRGTVEVLEDGAMYCARLKLGTGVLLQNPESLAELEREVACTAAPWLVVRTLPKPVSMRTLTPSPFS